MAPLPLSGEHPPDELVDFDAFVRARTPSLIRAAYLLTGDQHLAEDLVQSALARTHLHWRKIEHHGGGEAYARKVMYHLQVNRWRRRRVAEAIPARLPDRPVRSHDERSVTRLVLRQALMRLTDRQRAVLVLRYFEDMTEAETARMLDISVGTVKSQAAKALAKLRETAPELAAFTAEETAR